MTVEEMRMIEATAATSKRKDPKTLLGSM